MSKRIAFAPLAAAIGLGFSLLAGSLVAPASAHAAVSYTHLTLPTKA